MPEIGEEIKSNIEFGNPNILALPEIRNYQYVYYEGEKKGKWFSFELRSIPFEELRENYSARRIDLPEVVGNWKLMNYWIESMWDALLNPITQLRFPDDDPKQRGRKWAVIGGQHRLRLLDAMDINTLWFYEAKYPEYDRFDWRIIGSDLSSEINAIMELNRRDPVQGTVNGTCIHCGEWTAWKKVTVHKLWDVRKYCKKCGRINPYPYPGRL